MVEETYQRMLLHAIVGIAPSADFDGATISTFCAEELCAWCELFGSAGEWEATVSCSIGIVGAICGRQQTRKIDIKFVLELPSFTL